MIMNQKFIVRFCLAAALLCGPVLVSAYAAPVKADSDQNPSGQTITVRGTVYDDQGAPLPGAGVMVKGTTQGTVTDLDGNYEIRVKPNQTLVITFVGMKDQEIPVGGRTSINAALDSQATTLDDVVVVGYGTIKKANLTGAVDVVDSKTFERRVAANVDQMLSGAMPSVSMATMDGAPYRNTNNLSGYQVRGVFQSLAKNSAAGDYFGSLVLIDGVEGDPSGLNPNDIESVTVLKDAAASAIYGSRGAYGVVLITTKNPTQEEKVMVSYSGNFNFMTPTAMPELLTDGELYANIRAQAYYGYNDAYKATANVWPASTDLRTIAQGYADVREGKKEVVNGVHTTSKGKYEYYGATDWFDEIYKDWTTSQIHNVTVNGNNGRVSYLLSGRFYDYNGIYVGKSDPYQTYNLRSKINVQVLPWLTLSENMEYSYDDIQYGITTNGDGVSAPQAKLLTYGAPTWTIYNPDGTFTKAGALVMSGLVGDAYDPDAPNRRGKEKLTKNMRTSTALTAAFFNNTLRFKGDFTYRDKNMSFLTKDTAQYYSDADGVMTYSLADNKINRQSIKANRDNITWMTTNWTGEYENTFGRHWLKLMAGFNYEKRVRSTEEFKKYGLAYEDALAENPWAFATGTLKDDTSQTGWMTGSAENFKLKRWRNAGTFFRVNYSYDDRYLLEVNGRYDGSSVYVNQYQWGFFPSVSAAWRPTQEHWWHLDPRWISSLKFRVSYGELGDCMGAGAYGTEDTFTIGEATNRIINGASSVRVYEIPDATNSAYTWSTVKTLNFGVDAAFFNNKFDVTAEYFIRRNMNMLTEGFAHTDTYGQDDLLGNNADMSTYGWEVTAHYNDHFMLAGKPFHFGARFAIGNHYTIVDRFDGNEPQSIKAFQYRVGERLGEVWGFRANGLFQNEEEIANAFGTGVPYAIDDTFQYDKKKRVLPGDIWLKDLDGNNKITYGDQTAKNPGDMEIIGNKMPQFPFSFGLNFEWNNWFLNAGFQGILHQNFFVYGGFLGINAYGYNYGPMTKWFVDKYWTEDNPDALFPRLSMGNKLLSNSTQTAWNVKFSKFPVDRYMFEAGYINLQTLQFGYSIPKKLIQKINLDEARIYFSGENLWNWSPFYKTFGRDYDITTLTYAGDDPTEALNWFTGYGYQYPKLRTLSIGLNLTFSSGSRKVESAGVNAAALTSALAAANAAADAANAAAAKAQAEVDALKAELAKALKDKDDCEAAKKPMAVRRAEALHLEDIYFEINQSVIRDSEAYKVTKLIEVLKANPDANVSITGYADQGTGTELRNLVLTKERAEVVAEALKAAGIAADRIRTEFYGTEKDSSFTPENNRLAVCIVK